MTIFFEQLLFVMLVFAAILLSVLVYRNTLNKMSSMEGETFEIKVDSPTPKKMRSRVLTSEVGGKKDEKSN